MRKKEGGRAGEGGGDDGLRIRIWDFLGLGLGFGFVKGGIEIWVSGSRFWDLNLGAATWHLHVNSVNKNG